MKSRLRKKYQRQAQQKAEAARKERQGRQERQGRPVDAGWQLFQAGQYREAIAVWKNALPEEEQVLRPVLAEAYFRLALEQHAAGKEQPAQTFLQQAANLVSDQWLYHYHLALTWQRLGNLACAAAAYRQALAGRPDNQRVLLHLGLLVVQQELTSPDAALAAWLAGPEGQRLTAPAREFLSSLSAMLRGETRGDNPAPAGCHSRTLSSDPVGVQGINSAPDAFQGSNYSLLGKSQNRGGGNSRPGAARAAPDRARSQEKSGEKSPSDEPISSGVLSSEVPVAAAMNEYPAGDPLPAEPLDSSAAFLAGIAYARQEQWAAASGDGR